MKAPNSRRFAVSKYYVFVDEARYDLLFFARTPHRIVSDADRPENGGVDRSEIAPAVLRYAGCGHQSIKKDIAMLKIHASPYERPVAVFSGLLLATLLASGAALAAASTPSASIIAMSQKPKGDAVSITYAFLPQDGLLAIYPVNSSGKISAAPLGQVMLTAGDHRDVSVTLKPSPKSGAKLEAVIEHGGQPLKASGDLAERTFRIL